MGRFWPRDHFHNVAIRQRGAQGLELPIDLHADGAITDVRVNGVRKVQRHSAPGQTDQLALWGEDEYLIQIHLELRMLDQIL